MERKVARVAEGWRGVGIALECLPHTIPRQDGKNPCFSGLTPTWGFDFVFIFILFTLKKGVGRRTVSCKQ